jgi:hypothetical protein
MTCLLFHVTKRVNAYVQRLNGYYRAIPFRPLFFGGALIVAGRVLPRSGEQFLHHTAGDVGQAEVPSAVAVG